MVRMIRPLMPIVCDGVTRIVAIRMMPLRIMMARARIVDAVSANFSFTLVAAGDENKPHRQCNHDSCELASRHHRRILSNHLAWKHCLKKCSHHRHRRKRRTAGRCRQTQTQPLRRRNNQSRSQKSAANRERNRTKTRVVPARWRSVQ